MSRRAPDDGAVLIVVALTLIAMFGMAVLVVDVGGLLVSRRNVVRAADSAALAAAQSCARNLGGEAPSQADSFARDNDDDIRIPAKAYSDAGCGTASVGLVEVTYEKTQNVYFAPVLGFPEDYDVPGSATAIWAPANAANAAPILISSGAFQGPCDVPNIAVGTRCAFWYDPNELGDADWGFMNLNHVDPSKGWDVAPNYNCPNTGAADRREWIENDYPVPLPLNFPDPTYVCVDTGAANADWQALRDEIATDPIKIFPVNDPYGIYGSEHGQVDKQGNQAPPPETPDKYDIVGFVELELIALYDGNEEAAIGTDPVPGGSGRCDHTRRAIASDAPYNMDFFSEPGCPRGLRPDTITPRNPFVYRVQNPGAVKVPFTACSTAAGTSPTGCRYYYDAAAHTVDWFGATQNGVHIDFDWLKTGSPGVNGACETDSIQRSSTPNAKCLVTEWVGYTSDGTDPNPDGIDFGIRAIRLCEAAAEAVLCSR